jgi:site-specific DNA recombinase
LKAAIYIRVSTPGQAVNGESLDMQKERLIEYVKNQKWELYKVYEDGGFSGGTTNRPAFQEMMRDAEAKKFDVLVVYKIDRLSRSVLDFHITMKTFEKHNIEFVSITQQFDTTTTMGRLMLNVLVDFANFEREINIDRARDSYLSRLKGGVHSGRTPYGYKRENKLLVIIPEQAEIIKEIFNLALQGLSSNKTAEKLNMDHDHVKSIITNPFYTGYVCPRKDKYGHRIQNTDKWYKGQHEGIISLDAYRRILEMRKKVSTSKHIGLFAKTIYCPYCKHNLTYHHRLVEGREYNKYICEPVEPKGNRCYQHTDEEFLEDLLITKLDSLFKLKFPEKSDTDIKDKIAKIDKKVSKAIALLDIEDISVEEIKNKIEELKRQKARLLVKNITHFDYKKINEKMKVFKKLYPYMTREEKKRLWGLTIEKIIAYHDELEVHWKDGTVTRFARKRKRTGGASNSPHLHQSSIRTYLV